MWFRIAYSSGFALITSLLFAGDIIADEAAPSHWRQEWSRTDFSRHSVPLEEIQSGGPRKDGIPPIDGPAFASVTKITNLTPTEPVISVRIGGKDRAYPLRILIWHEIVNDHVGGIPIAVTYCPLCNSSIVFDRRIDGLTLDFGTTGKLRHSDLVMYDRQTESWWQQFLGEAIVGTMTGKRLASIPSRVESFARFRQRAPDGEVLVPDDQDLRPYGKNPYVGYDSSARPFLYKGSLPSGVPPLERVVVVGKEAWTLSLLKKRGTIIVGDVTITWEPGQNSALDASLVSDGHDIGNITVTRRTQEENQDIVYDVSFAFAFHAFVPGGVIHF